MGAAVGADMQSMAGLCLGALIGSLIGTGIKRLDVFGFKQWGIVFAYILC